MSDTCLESCEPKKITRYLVSVIMASVKCSQMDCSVNKLERKMGEARPSHMACTVFRGIVEGQVILSFGHPEFVT